ncbi:T6SS phospholipase effector Tle1-like catalytic domain-containing protein [Burkholderia sp. PU8-34]
MELQVSERESAGVEVMNVKWPERMPEGGRLLSKEAGDAWAIGYCSVADPQMSCQQTVHVSLFFDGTNNNDDEDNPKWRDSKTDHHTNVARLHNAARHKPEDGIYKYYIPGVGTPFKKIGEETYSQDGKALAKGFNQRCVWAYTRVLNAVHDAIRKDSLWELIDDKDAKRLSNDGAFCDEQTFKQCFTHHVNRLQVAHTKAANENTIKKIWINVIGFSRGAAAARAFVNKLINEWAPNGKLAENTDDRLQGEKANNRPLPYQVNFMGLFDTVASVGLPDSFRTALNLDVLDGHAHFASNGGLAIPDSVRNCVHAFSIHEQRMSFPLDSIRQGSSYAGGEVRREIAYPGVHSDVGGGYGPGEQGKGCDSNGKGMDERKLSQIALHDMYIAALRYGVPLMKADAILENEYLKPDFELHADTITAFNAWRQTTNPVTRLEDAMHFGMAQMLSWRALRAQVSDATYVTNQNFFKWAREDGLTPRKVTQALEKAKPDDPRLRELNARRREALVALSQARASKPYPENVPAVDAAQAEVDAADEAIRTRTEELCAEVAYHDTAPSQRPESGRPGEGAGDITTNDQTDLRQGAEEMRLLLAHLHPDQRVKLSVDELDAAVQPPEHLAAINRAKTLSVPHTQPGSDSHRMSLVDVGVIKFHAARTSLKQKYNAADDVLPKPVAEVVSFLQQHTSEHAFKTLPEAAANLYDNYVHDSRCWFRVPYFHEYAPGGYGWPRVVFVGKKRLPWLGKDPLAVAFHMFDSVETAVA